MIDQQKPDAAAKQQPNAAKRPATAPADGNGPGKKQAVKGGGGGGGAKPPSMKSTPSNGGAGTSNDANGAKAGPSSKAGPPTKPVMPAKPAMPAQPQPPAAQVTMHAVQQQIKAHTNAIDLEDATTVVAHMDRVHGSVKSMGYNKGIDEADAHLAAAKRELDAMRNAANPEARRAAFKKVKNASNEMDRIQSQALAVVAAKDSCTEMCKRVVDQLKASQDHQIREGLARPLIEAIVKEVVPGIVESLVPGLLKERVKPLVSEHVANEMAARVEVNIDESRVRQVVAEEVKKSDALRRLSENAAATVMVRLSEVMTEGAAAMRIKAAADEPEPDHNPSENEIENENPSEHEYDNPSENGSDDPSANGSDDPPGNEADDPPGNEADDPPGNKADDPPAERGAGEAELEEGECAKDPKRVEDLLD